MIELIWNQLVITGIELWMNEFGINGRTGVRTTHLITIIVVVVISCLSRLDWTIPQITNSEIETIWEIQEIQQIMKRYYL